MKYKHQFDTINVSQGGSKQSRIQFTYTLAETDKSKDQSRNMTKRSNLSDNSQDITITQNTVKKNIFSQDYQAASLTTAFSLRTAEKLLFILISILETTAVAAQNSNTTVALQTTINSNASNTQPTNSAGWTSAEIAIFVSIMTIGVAVFGAIAGFFFNYKQYLLHQRELIAQELASTMVAYQDLTARLEKQQQHFIHLADNDDIDKSNIAIKNINETIREREKLRGTLIADISSMFDWDVHDHRYETALHRAAKYDNIKLVERLIAEGANVNAQNDRDETPLHIAIKHQSTKTIKALLQSESIKLDRYDSEGYYPIHLAAKRNLHEATKMMIKIGVGIKLKNLKDNNNTPLHYTSLECAEESALVLIKSLKKEEHDIWNLMNKVGKTPRDYLRNHSDSVKSIILLKILGGQNTNITESDLSKFYWRRWRYFNKFNTEWDILLLNGLPNVGKSMLAIDYLLYYCKQNPKDIIWKIDARTETDLLSSLKELAERMFFSTIKNMNDVLKFIEKKLASVDDKIILLFDNFSKDSFSETGMRNFLKFIEALLQANVANSKNIKIIITSQKPSKYIITSKSIQAKNITLGGLDAPELKTFFTTERLALKKIEITDREAVDLTDKIGDTPLSLLLAKSYISKFLLSISTYIEGLEANYQETTVVERTIIQEIDPVQKNLPHRFIGIKMIVDQLTPEARYFIYCVSLYGDSRIPISIITRIIEEICGCSKDEGLDSKQKHILYDLESSLLVEKTDKYIIVQRVVGAALRCFIKDLPNDEYIVCIIRALTSLVVFNKDKINLDMREYTSYIPLAENIVSYIQKLKHESLLSDEKRQHPYLLLARLIDAMSLYYNFIGMAKIKGTIEYSERAKYYLNSALNIDKGKLSSKALYDKLMNVMYKPVKGKESSTSIVYASIIYNAGRVRLHHKPEEASEYFTTTQELCSLIRKKLNINVIYDLLSNRSKLEYIVRYQKSASHEQIEIAIRKLQVLSKDKEKYYNEDWELIDIAHDYLHQFYCNKVALIGYTNFKKIITHELSEGAAFLNGKKCVSELLSLTKKEEVKGIVSHIYIYIGEFFNAFSKYTKAAEYFKLACDEIIKTGIKDLTLAKSYEDLAKVLARLNELEKAGKYIRKAIEIYDENLMTKHLRIAQEYENEIEESGIDGSGSSSPYLFFAGSSKTGSDSELDSNSLDQTTTEYAL